jgi:membrane protein involved in colicin uptake
MLVVALSLLFASFVWAEIYKWVDEKGSVHFTDDPTTIPEKFKNQTNSRETEEDRMTIQQRTEVNKEQEKRARERIKRDQSEYERSLKEESDRKTKREFEEALYQKKLEREKEIKRQDEAIKKKEQEEKDAYKKCWNCDGKGYIGKEVVESWGGVPFPGGRSFNVNKTCSICGGTGYLKK